MLGTSVAATAAALLSAMPSVYAGGQAIIKNYCDFEVYSWSVDTETNPTEPTIIEAGGEYSETYRTPASGGVSIKLALENDLFKPITQLEYTLNYDIWYDVSNVNCHETECPFQPHGLYMESGSGCPTVSCSPGNLTCHGAYTLWDDNWASLCCTDSTADVYLYLCSDSSTPPSSSPPPVYSSAPAVEEAKADPRKHRPAPVIHEAKVTPKPHHDKPTPTPVEPTPVEPATEVVEVTEFATVVVTVTPEAKPKRDEHIARHVHNHAHVHAHGRH